MKKRVLALMMAAAMVLAMAMTASADEASPDAANPDEVSADAAAPDEATPDAAAPDEADPDAADPDAADPDAATPDEADPDAADPDAAAPDEADPDVAVPEAAVTKTIQLDGATFTLTAAAIADGEEITITASGMEDGYDSWCILIHPVKGNQEFFSAVLEEGQTDFISRSEVMDVMDDWQASGFMIDANTSRTFTLHIPEEYAGWTIDARISGKAQGTYSTNVDPLILFEGEQTEAPVEVSFDDVTEGDWFYRFVAPVVASGQMAGMGDGKFDPNGNLTVAQVLTLAARTDMRNKGAGDLAPASEGPWYTPFVDYCVENEIIAAGQFSEEDMNRSATRYEMAVILDAAVDGSATQPINDVPNGFIPDVSEEDSYGAVIYKWYRAGITTGYEDHSFLGERTITRAETSVILCHLSNLVERAVIG